MSTTPEIISNYLSSFINRTGLLPFTESRFLFRNFCSEQPYNLLNNNLLFCHKHILGLNSYFYGTFSQIKQFSGRLGYQSEGAITTWLDRVGSDDNNHFAYKYYFSFSLAQCNLYQDFIHLENEYIYRDAREESQQIIEQGFNKLGTDNPLKSADYPCVDNYYTASIKKMVEFCPTQHRKTSLVCQLASSYLLNKAGYKLNHPYSKEDVQQLSKKIRDEPNWTINTFNHSQQIINYLIN